MIFVKLRQERIVLEAFQDESQAELNLCQDEQKESEAALEAAHQAAMEAARQTSEAELRMVQKAGDEAVKNAMDEIKLLEGKVEHLRTENNQMRRSLDEAIHRLQSSQEDVIDRTLMKNIVIDWCTMKDNDKNANKNTNE